MPKKKTGARKKAEKQKQRQKDIQQGSKSVPITKFPCNFVMVSTRFFLCERCTLYYQSPPLPERKVSACLGNFVVNLLDLDGKKGF